MVGAGRTLRRSGSRRGATRGDERRGSAGRVQCYHLKMDCPKCGFEQVADAACPRCGVVIAKFQARSAAPAPTAADPAAPASATPRFKAAFPAAEAEQSRRSPLRNVVNVLGIIGALAGGVAWYVASGRQRPAGETPAETAFSTPSGSAPDTSADVPQLTAAPPPPPLPTISEDELPGLTKADHETLRDLGRRAGNRPWAGTSRDSITQAEVDRAEDLVRRHPEEKTVLEVAAAVLMRWSEWLASQRQMAPAVETLRRAIALRPESLPPRDALLRLLIAQSEWPALEQEAQAVLALDGRSRAGHEALGYALMRLGRDREAVEELKAAIALGMSPMAEKLLSKLRKESQDEAAMKEQSMGDFTLRYEGAAHEGVGNEILRALERHYSKLVSALDHHPAAPIPVILFTQQEYFRATDAPRWSGGLYDSSDGRIRMPVGGLTTSLSPEIDGVLLHELTHAFVADMSRGRAPGALHEGLAQYMEGARLEEMLTSGQLKRLADGRVSSVAQTYLGGLCFTEYLIEQRGWGGIKDLLQAMAQGEGDAFVQVYGKKGEELGREAYERLQQRYGS
jgi:tetratricopeptide (TPR) repeat protein